MNTPTIGLTIAGAGLATFLAGELVVKNGWQGVPLDILGAIMMIGGVIITIAGSGAVKINVLGAI